MLTTIADAVSCARLADSVTSVLERLKASLSDRYRFERELGEGGMAVVFLATDLKHDRQVAVKVLRPELSAIVGADRFLREIHVTAQLQHPHILALFDSGVADQLLYYVMPMVRGESLRDRLTREHQLPVDEAISITRTIAGALDYAHRQGVLHRDIKPENILLEDGQPMLADFGIALAASGVEGERLTQSGVFVGTPSYMSPEQAAGEGTIDARSDIYSLACVAYEMLSGEPPFVGRSTQAVFAAIMTTEAKPLVQRRRTAPDGAAAAIHRALERVPADRFATAAEFGDALAAAPQATRRRPSPLRRRLQTNLLIGIAAGLVVGALIARLATPITRPAMRRWNIVLPQNAPVALTDPSLDLTGQTAIALSPDGDHLAFVRRSDTTTLIAVRPLDSDSAVTLPGTEGAYYPFYSPDGAWISFFSGNLLRKVPATGGPPVTVAQVERVTGAAYTALDRIVVLENGGFDLHLISASGTTPDSTLRLTTQFGTPDVLPGGQWAVGQLSSGQLALLSLSTGTELAITRRGVLPLDSVRQADLLFGTSPRWLSSGQLVYAAGDGVLNAMPFGWPDRKVSGGPVSLISGVRMEAGFGYAEFSISRDGTLIYVPGGSQLYSTLAFVTPQGGIDTLPFPRAEYTSPRMSPDGSRFAIQERRPLGGWQLLLMDLTSGVRQQIDVQGNFRPFPASWLPSGKELMIGLWDPVQFLNHGARIQSIETGRWTDLHLPGASYLTVSPDGRSLAFSDWRTGDLYLRSLGADTAITRIPARGFSSSFSPDGRWLAWGSTNGSVGVSPLPPTGATYVVAERGAIPTWTPHGDGLVYRDGSRLYRMPVSTAGGFHAGRPQLLAQLSFVATFGWNDAMAPDGRLLVMLNSPERESRTLGVITAFPTMVERLTSAK